MDSMDRVKALEELDGHKIKKYNVWKVHLSEEKEERGHLCKWSSHNFKNSQKKTTKQGPYLIKGKIVKEVSSLLYFQEFTKEVNQTRPLPH